MRNNQNSFDMGKKKGKRKGCWGGGRGRPKKSSKLRGKTIPAKNWPGTKAKSPKRNAGGRSSTFPEHGNRGQSGGGVTGVHSQRKRGSISWRVWKKLGEKREKKKNYHWPLAK